jgi:hypothetical protein
VVFEAIGLEALISAKFYAAGIVSNTRSTASNAAKNLFEFLFIQISSPNFK